jgi:hypothetical protein
LRYNVAVADARRDDFPNNFVGDLVFAAVVVGDATEDRLQWTKTSSDGTLSPRRASRESNHAGGKFGPLFQLPETG